MPQGGMDALLNKDPLEILAWQYDIVCNGIELSSGAIRNHRPDIMYKAFEIVGYDRSVVDEKFGGMINAFKLGAPPPLGRTMNREKTLKSETCEEAGCLDRPQKKPIHNKTGKEKTNLFPRFVSWARNRKFNSSRV